MSKNIVEAYKEFNGQFVILVSGLSGSRKTKLGRNICSDFKFELLNTKNFFNKGFSETVTLSNGIVITNYESDDVVNWDALNKEINKKKLNGVVVVGEVFPTEKLKFTPNYHVHIKISKQYLRDKRIEYIENNKDKNFDIETEKLRINAISYPYYLESLKNMKFDKFIELVDMNDDQIYDLVFDDIMKFIKDNLSSHNSKPTHKPINKIYDETTVSTTQYESPYNITYSENS